MGATDMQHWLFWTIAFTVLSLVAWQSQYMWLSGFSAGVAFVDTCMSMIDYISKRHV
jgi:hypothetical protein